MEALCEDEIKFVFRSEQLENIFKHLGSTSHG